MSPSAPSVAPRRGQGVVEGAKVSAALLSAFNSLSMDSKSASPAELSEQASTSSPRALVGLTWQSSSGSRASVTASSSRRQSASTDRTSVLGRASFESERRFSFESDDWRSVTETGGYARLSGDWTAPPPPDGAPPAAEWPLEAAGPEIMHALSTLQEETIAEAAAGPADDAAGRTPPRISSRLQSRPVPAPRSLSVQSSTAQHIGDVSEVRLSEAGSLPAATTSSADEQASSSGGASPPSRPDSGLRRAPRKGQGPVEGHRMSPAVIAAIAEWCWRRRATAGMSGHDNAASCSTGGRRRWPSGPAQPAAPALAGASARLGASAKLRSRQRALPPIPLAEGADTGAGGHRHQRGFSSLASSLSSGLQSSGLARTSIRAESQLSASADMGASSLDHPAGDGGVVSSEEHSVSVSDTAQTTGDASGELLGDGDFELLRRVPGIRTGRRVSFDASLGRASTDDDATGGGSGDAASESPTASSLEPADVSPSLDGGADGVDSPRECAAAAACEDDPAEARGATSGPAAAAAARPELPELHSPACTTVAATRRSVMLLVVAAAAVTPLLARFMGLNVASLLSALVCALAMAAVLRGPMSSQHPGP